MQNKTIYVATHEHTTTNESTINICEEEVCDDRCGDEGLQYNTQQSTEVLEDMKDVVAADIT